MSSPLDNIYARLAAHYGSRQDRSNDAPFELLVGVILIPNTSPKNLAMALDNLREAGLLDIRRLYESSDEELEELIRPAGHAGVKSRRLRHVLAMLVERYDASLAQMFASGLQSLRSELLAINGISPETADAILLFAGNLPSFVVDLPAHRVLKRHGLIEFSADDQQIKDYFEGSLDRDAALYREFHMLLERVGTEHCRKMPRCDVCPLNDLLPDGGPLEPPDF